MLPVSNHPPTQPTLLPTTHPTPSQSRIYNLRETKVIRDLNPIDINKLISVSGMVTRTSGVIPDQSLALFACTQCGAEEVSWNDRGKVNEPAKCPNAACQVGWVGRWGCEGWG